MNIGNIILIPIVGAIIGYFTNWLAIKMIFRPHSEKRIFGVKVPFTPGLIPKERYTLSKKMGEALSSHILTKEVLEESINSPVFLESIKKIVEDFFSNIKNSDKTFEQYFNTLFKNKKDSIISKIHYIVVETLGNIFKNTYIQKEIINLIIEKILVYLKNNSFKENSSGIVEKIRPFVIEKSEDFFRSPNFKEYINKNIQSFIEKLSENENAVNHYVSEQFINSLKSIIRNNTADISNKLRKFLEKNPQLDDDLNKLAQKVVEENVSKFALMFVSKDKIYFSIKNSLFDYLSDEKVLEDINLKLCTMLDNFLKGSVKGYIDKVPKDIEFKLSEKIFSFVEKTLAENIVNKVFDYILDCIEKSDNITFFDSITKFEPDFENKLDKFVSYNIQEFFNNNAIVVINELIKKYESIFLSSKISTVTLKIDNDTISSFNSYMMKIIAYALSKGSVYLSQNINIGEIVENQINKFEMDDAEKILVSVINRELNAITILGGVLGFFIGIVTALFQTL